MEGHLGDLNTLWGLHNSYNQIALSARVSDFYQLPDNRSEYIDDFPDGDLSSGGKYMKVLNDAVASAPSGLEWTNVDALMVLNGRNGCEPVSSWSGQQVHAEKWVRRQRCLEAGRMRDLQPEPGHLIDLR